MSLRLWRRKTLFPGFRLNLSKSGVSLSAGRRGAWYTVGPRGKRATVGWPGSGVFYTVPISARHDVEGAPAPRYAIWAAVIVGVIVLFAIAGH